jgi:hypothetical protein
MTRTLIWSSLTRVIEHRGRDVDWEPRQRAEWDEGDLVAAEAAESGGLIEAPDGHHVRVETGDVVIGALGTRRATLEVVGGWRDVRDDGYIQSLTRGGVLGRVTSVASEFTPYVIDLRYLGHVRLDGRRTGLRDWMLPPAGPPVIPPTPAIVLIGTSMSSGKTTTARIVIRRLASMGLRVVGAKLAGVARYADVLAMRDSGAEAIFDFVDGGLPSTAMGQDVVVESTRRVLAAVDALGADVLVAEAGASPLEPYRGSAVLRELAPRRRMTILCASDPYAVVGAERAFDVRADFVAGRAAATSAAIALVSGLSDLEAIDVTDRASWPRIDARLVEALGVERARGGSPRADGPRGPGARAPG